MLFFNFDDDKGILKYKKDKNIIKKSSNDFYKSLLTQIDLQKNNVTLITSIKNFEINIGDLNMLETKFENLYSFYERIVKFKGWNYYNKVNLKYVDQIICSKK